MKISTVWNTTADTSEAVGAAYRQLRSELGHDPQLLIAYSTMKHPAGQMARALQQACPGVPVHGATSCLGVMTAEGFHSADGIGLGLFGVFDPEGNYGVGFVEIENDPRAAGAAAIQQAIAGAGRVGEPPQLIWLNGTPGYEEQVLAGIEDIVGSNVPIIGGSAADNTVAGQWNQFTQSRFSQSAVMVTAMYPSVPTHYAFHSGYVPTSVRGVATKAEGHTLHELNGRPAAQLYNEWTNGAIAGFLTGGNILAMTTLYPLGRVVGKVGEIPYYRLSHPDSVTPEGALTFFTEIENGDELALMTGSRDSLVERAGMTALSALEAGRIRTEQISGSLVVYCAGCMLTVQDRMPEVAAGVSAALGGKPLIGVFTFGEQGCFVGGENRHGNLMISVIVFEKG